jgi:chorismate mutase
MDIADWRRKIDELDEQIVQLINERAKAARAIGELKQAQNLPVYEPQREKDVFAHVRRSNPGPLSEVEIVDVYERIIDVMRALQKHHD